MKLKTVALVAAFGLPVLAGIGHGPAGSRQGPADHACPRLLVVSGTRRRRSLCDLRREARVRSGPPPVPPPPSLGRFTTLVGPGQRGGTRPTSPRTSSR